MFYCCTFLFLTLTHAQTNELQQEQLVGSWVSAHTTCGEEDFTKEELTDLYFGGGSSILTHTILTMYDSGEYSYNIYNGSLCEGVPHDMYEYQLDNGIVYNYACQDPIWTKGRYYKTLNGSFFFESTQHKRDVSAAALGLYYGQWQNPKLILKDGVLIMTINENNTPCKGAEYVRYLIPAPMS